MVRNSNVYETDFSPGEQSVVAAILRAVAAIEGVKATELPCFERQLSGEGLDALIESNYDVEVQFPYGEYEITVRGDGSLIVRETR